MLDIAISAKDEEYIETQSLQEQGCKVVSTSDKYSRNGSNGLFIIVLVVEFAESGHLFFDSLVLNKSRVTDLEI